MFVHFGALFSVGQESGFGSWHQFVSRTASVAQSVVESGLLQEGATVRTGRLKLGVKRRRIGQRLPAFRALDDLFRAQPTVAEGAVVAANVTVRLAPYHRDDARLACVRFFLLLVASSEECHTYLSRPPRGASNGYVSRTPAGAASVRTKEDQRYIMDSQSRPAQSFPARVRERLPRRPAPPVGKAKPGSAAATPRLDLAG